MSLNKWMENRAHRAWDCLYLFQSSHTKDCHHSLGRFKMASTLVVTVGLFSSIISHTIHQRPVVLTMQRPLGFLQDLLYLIRG